MKSVLWKNALRKIVLVYLLSTVDVPLFSLRQWPLVSIHLEATASYSEATEDSHSVLRHYSFHLLWGLWFAFLKPLLPFILLSLVPIYSAAFPALAILLVHLKQQVYITMSATLFVCLP